MSCGVEFVLEELIDPRASVLPGRQANAVDHQQTDCCFRGPRVEIGRGHVPRGREPAGGVESVARGA